MTTGAGAADAVVAGDGTLVYVSGVAAGQRTLVWVDRQGQEMPIPVPPRAHVYPRLAPDGTRVALTIIDQESDIWLWDPARTTLRRVTFDGAGDYQQAWMPDGRRLIFSSERAGARNLFWQAADGTGAVERLTESPNTQNAASVTPDGTRLIFTETSPKTGDDLMQVLLERTRRITPLVQTPFNERNGFVSPDGRWLPARQSRTSCEYAPCFHRTRRLRLRPAAVLGPVLVPPCIRQRPFRIAGPRQGVCLRVFAPHRSA